MEVQAITTGANPAFQNASHIEEIRRLFLGTVQQEMRTIRPSARFVPPLRDHRSVIIWRACAVVYAPPLLQKAPARKQSRSRANFHAEVIIYPKNPVHSVLLVFVGGLKRI
jgi:hypothetical protein